jgi:plastocyanin
VEKNIPIGDDVKMRKDVQKGIIALAVLASVSSFSLMGCSSNTSSTAQSGTATTPQSNREQPAKKEPAATSPQAAPVSTQAAPTVANDQPENVYLTIEPGAKLGADKKLHDAFINGDIKITAGKAVTLNIFNYDDGTHTMTSPDLGMNIKIKGSTKKGQPALTTFTLTPSKEGTFIWFCADPCDGEKKQWAMAHDGYMKGKITVLPASNKVQHISMVINPDYKLGSDGKMHDAYTPGDFTVKAGQPVQLTIVNYGKNSHHFVSIDLGIDVPEKGRKSTGDPSIFTVTFTPKKAGNYQWNCVEPCDVRNGNFAMSHGNYMTGSIEVK